MDPTRHHGHMYAVSGWQKVGVTKGYPRKGDRYTAAHHRHKRMLLNLLRDDARGLLRSALPLAAKCQPKCQRSGLSIGQLESLYAALEQVNDVRRAQGRKHRNACVYAVYMLARYSEPRMNHAAALLRQIVEVEYLAWAIDSQYQDGRLWLRSNSNQRMK